jgi:hypothetical protein
VRTRRRERLKRQHNTEWVATYDSQMILQFVHSDNASYLWCCLLFINNTELAISHIHLSSLIPHI